MSKIHYESSETIITKDLTTQEATHLTEKTTRTVKVASEDAYIKVYLKDISMLHGLAPQQNLFLYELFNMASWNTNEIQLSVGKKKQLVDKLNTSMQTLNNAISKLVKKDILIKQDTGLYTLNPFLFGKGDWNSVRNLRLTIGYDFLTGEKTIEAEPTTQKTKIEREWELVEGIETEIEEMIETGII